MIESLAPILNKRALVKLGWTPGLVEALLGKPDEVKHHQHGLKHWTEHLYTRDRVIEAARDPRFVAHLERRKARAASAERRRAAIPQKYPTWKEALPEACAGMFSLNRYAKHQACSEMQKVEIYRLKNELIKVLYQGGFATAAWIHRLQQEARPCWGCEGAGGDCDRCDGSGIYQSARVLEFWCFRFLIAEKPYCWHQPRHLVDFTPAESVPPQDWEGFTSQEKPIAIPKARFAAIKELLRWLIDRANAAADGEENTSEASVEERLPFDGLDGNHAAIVYSSSPPSAPQEILPF